MESLSPVDPDSKMIPDEQLLEDVPHNPDVGPASLDTNKCKPNTSFIWCLPQDYNQEKHPFTCKIWQIFVCFLIYFTFRL